MRNKGEDFKMLLFLASRCIQQYVFILGGFSPVQEETSLWQRTETEKQLQVCYLHSIVCSDNKVWVKVILAIN